MQSAASRLKRRVAETAVSLAPKDSGISRLGKSAALQKKRIAIVSAPVPPRRYIRPSRRVVAKSQSRSPDREGGFHQQHEISLMVHASFPPFARSVLPGVGKRVVTRTGRPVPAIILFANRSANRPELPMEANHHRRVGDPALGLRAAPPGKAKATGVASRYPKASKALLPIRSRLICELGRRRPAPGQQERPTRAVNFCRCLTTARNRKARSSSSVRCTTNLPGIIRGRWSRCFRSPPVIWKAPPVRRCRGSPEVGGGVLCYCEHRMISVAPMI